MAAAGRAILILALAVTLYGIGAALVGARRGRGDLIDSARRSVYALAALTTVAFVVLEVAFVTSDFSFALVATHSSTTTPVAYRFAAPWSSQEGSLLLWVWLLSLWSSLALFLTRGRLRDVVPYATAVLLGFGAFFCALLVLMVSPFDQLALPPGEGLGLNPLLRHPGMMAHPPMLYSGYTLFAVPFAFAVGALVRRRVDADWIVATRRFALAAWLFLGAGIVLGARWSYTELGWGGYWGWDPVENASLLPWLTGTAFLHSVVVQERRGMLKVWNVSLVLTTGVLAILGTFLVRSGVLASIHAFGASTLGVPFVVLIAVLTLGSVALVVSRRAALRSEHRLDSLVSREAVFLANNLVLVGLAFVVFWGTFFPLISEALTGQKRSLGPPWFDRYTVPLALVLVLLSGIGPAVAWRRATRASIRRGFRVPVAAGAVALGALLVAGAGGSPLALAMFAVAAFVAATVGQELWRGARARRAMGGERLPAALLALVGRNRRRYGGLLVHLGVAVLFVGVAASSAFRDERDLVLRPGQSTRVGDVRVTYVRSRAALLTQGGRLEAIRLGALLRVQRGDEVFPATVERRYFPATNAPSLGGVGRYFEGQATSEVALRAGLTRDFWAAYQPDQAAITPFVDALDRRVAGAGPVVQQQAALNLAAFLEQRAIPGTFRFISSPMVAWVWIGALIVLAGGLVALWPAPDAVRRRATARAKARVGHDLARA